MTEIALLVLVAISLIAVGALCFGVGYVIGARAASQVMTKALKESGVDREMAERIVVGLKRPRSES